LSESDDLETALARVRQEIAAADSTEFRIIVEGERRRLNPLIRDQLYRIGREALSNAFRHSGAGTVELEIHYGVKDLRLRVHDTGRGIAEDIVRGGREVHWGLIGMRETAEKIGGQLKLRSGAELGT